jgi:NAD(P)-dependent dehydrogenase (short-subunit alcohol dehydrogenase family)
VDQTSETSPAMHGAAVPGLDQRRLGRGQRETRVRPVPVVMDRVLPQGSLEVAPAEDQEIVAVADAISVDGRTAAAVEVDALDEDAVNRHLDDVVAIVGRIDIFFDAMGPQPSEYGNGTSTMDLPVQQFMVPITQIVPSLFITARSAARHMARQGSGVLVFLSATPSRGVAPSTSAIGAAYGAVEAVSRSLAVELGPRGVRVVCVRSMGMAETRTMEQTYDIGARAMGVPKAKMAELVTSKALLRRSPSLGDTAKLISFLASDEARSITGAIVNSSSGQVLD